MDLKKMTLIELDAKTCWKRWMANGSLREAANEFAREGMVGRRTGKPYGFTAIEKAAYRWLSDANNWDEAKKDFIYYCQSFYHFTPTDDDWNGQLMLWLNHHFQTKSTFKAWLSENGKTELAKKHLNGVQLAKIYG